MLGVFFLVFSCNTIGKEEVAKQPTKVKLLQVLSGTIPMELTLSGNVEGERTVRLGFMVAGKVAYIGGQEGDALEKGQLLASLEDSDYQLGLQAAEGKLMEVQDKYNRLKLMYDRKSLSEADFVAIQAGLKQAKAQHQLRLRQVQNTKLYAPINGVLLKKGVVEGEIIEQGMPVFGISSIDQLKVDATVPASQIRKIRMGQDAKVQIYALDTMVMGRVVEVGKLADGATRTFGVKILIDNPDKAILPGMIADVSLEVGEQIERTFVPAGALMRDADDAKYVYIVDKDSQTAYKRNVSVGGFAGDNVEVSAGLKPGEWIAVEGVSRLEDGTPVKFD